MRAVLRTAALVLALVGFGAGPLAAQGNPQQPSGNQYSSNEVLDAGHRFFGTVSRGLAQIVEKAGSQWGLPNGYVLGQEAGGAVAVGVRYGDGVLYTKNAGDLRVFWQGPSLGFDFGGEGARTMMLIYSLPATEAIYQRFVGIDGSAYFVGGLRHDGAGRQQCRGGSDPHRRGAAARRQYRLSQVHAQLDLEPILSALVGSWFSAAVSRFRRSYPFAARARTNVGTKGTLAPYDSSVALDLTFLRRTRR